MNSGEIHKNRAWKRTLILALTVAIIWLASNRSWWALAQGGGWTTPVAISSPPGFSWFPDLAVDAFGNVHVVWCHTIFVEDRGLEHLQEQVYYTYWNGVRWSEPNDIVPPSRNIARNAIAADLLGNIHLVFRGGASNAITFRHQKAVFNEARSAAAWSTSHRINQGMSYMGDIGIDSQNVIHAIYDDTDHGEDNPLVLADIYYRQSVNSGQTWSAPINLDPQPGTGSARPYMEIGSNDVIYVTWDEGWDRISGTESDIHYGVFTYSSDRGETWAPPTVIEDPELMPAQLTVGSDGDGGVMLVWRTIVGDELFYQWSADGGRSWESRSVVPQIFARPWTIPFDMYDMATDSAGDIHLLVVGREIQEREALLGVYHLVWDGAQWSTPTRLFAEEGLYPEYPKVVVHAGNQLYAVWFTREESVWDQRANRKVWYSQSQSLAPYQQVIPLPTSTPKSPTPTPSPAPTVTPYPTLSRKNGGLSDDMYTESDDVLRLLIGLSPVVLVILIVMAVRLGWFSKLR